VKRNPRVFFSFRSPFSWLAIERLRRAAPEVLDRLEWIPFWEPDPHTQRALDEKGAIVHYVPMSKAKHLYILQDTKRLARRLGLEMAWPVDVDPWWELPHLGWLRARRLGRALPFYFAVTAARWQRGEDICDPEVVRAAAAAAGLDGDAVTGAADDPEIRAEGVGCLVEAYEDDIFGVPYFRLGWHRFWGFDRVDGFLAELAEAPGSRPAGAAAAAAADEVPEALRSKVGAYDTDSPGGCG
jgi:2-hydroxychromene-2-carboxylate isomerase